MTVDAYIAGLPEAQREIAKTIRKLILTSVPTLRETIKWGAPCFVASENVCSFMGHKKHANLYFFRGTELTDKHGLLEGAGKGMRHVKISSLKDIRKGPIATLVKAAAKLKT